MAHARITVLRRCIIIGVCNHDHFRQSTNNPNTSIILHGTYCELVCMVNINEVNNALSLTFPSLEFIKLISTYDYDYYEINSYGVEYDAVDIYSVNDNKIDFYYKVVNDDGKYKLVEW